MGFLSVTEYFSLSANGYRVSSLQPGGSGSSSQTFSSPSDFLRKREGLSRRAKMYYASGPHRGTAITSNSYKEGIDVPAPASPSTSTEGGKRAHSQSASPENDTHPKTKQKIEPGLVLAQAQALPNLAGGFRNIMPTSSIDSRSTTANW